MKAPSDITAQRRFASLLGENLLDVCLLNGAQIEQLYRHYELLTRWNKVLNLTAIRRMEDAVPRHYCESLFLAARVPVEPITLADVGSGAGFPGIPIAVLRPDCRVTLVESHKRKAVFLREATRDLANVRVVAERAEVVKESFDWMVSRAVKPVEVLRLLPRLAPRVGLLIGQTDCCNLLKIEDIIWDTLVPLPWGDQRVLLLGQFPG